MTTSTINKLPKSVVEITLTIPNADLKTEYEDVMQQVVSNFEMPGFRKGKVPRDVVEKNVDREKVASLVIRQALPKAYEEAIKAHDLNPIVDPKLEILEPKEKFGEILDGKDLKVKMTVAERPDIKLNDYKAKIKGETAKDAIWTPDKGKKPDEAEEKPEVKEQKKFVKIVDILLKTCTVDLADMVIEAEANRLLSQTLEEIKSLGLTLDQYLANTGKNGATLRDEAMNRANSSLKMSYLLDEIARQENLSVEKAEIEAILAKIEDPQQKADAEKNAYRLAPVFLRQKVVDFLMKL